MYELTIIANIVKEFIWFYAGANNGILIRLYLFYCIVMR